jgi:hypothetical protein
MGKGKENFSRMKKGFDSAKSKGDTLNQGIARREMNRQARRAQRFNAAGVDRPIIDKSTGEVTGTAVAQPGKAAAYLRKQADYLDKKAVKQGKQTSKSFKV